MEGAVHPERAAPGFVVVRDADGQRHALRVNSVLGVHETDDGRATLSLHGGRFVVVDASFDRTVAALSEGMTGRLHRPP